MATFGHLFMNWSLEAGYNEVFASGSHKDLRLVTDLC